MRLVAFDLETTGLDGEKARIVEFCFIELGDDLQELGRWTELVHPGIPIPAEVVKVHGIADADVAGRPGFRQFAPRIQALVQDAVLVAHNHRYDLEILARELQRAGERGLDPNHPCIDTYQIESFVNSNRLGAVYQRYTGQPLDDAHRSQADTVATVAILRHQLDRHKALLPGDRDGLLAANLERVIRPDGPTRRWLDHGRRFWADGDGVLRYGFGPFRDCPLQRVHDCTRDDPGQRDHRDYLASLARPGSRHSAATKELAQRFLEDLGTSPKPAASQRKFYTGTLGHVAFDFGKYRNCPAIEPHDCSIDLRATSHADYVRWMLGKDFDDDAKGQARTLLATAEARALVAAKPAAPAPVT